MDITANIAADMAALGLPSSFVARQDVASTKKIRRKSERPNSTSQSLSSESIDGVRADATPTTLLDKNGSIQRSKFCVRSVRLHTPLCPELQTVADDAPSTFRLGAEAAPDNIESGSHLTLSSASDFTMTASDEPSAVAFPDPPRNLDSAVAFPDPPRNLDSDVQLALNNGAFANGDTVCDSIWVSIWDDEYQCYYYFNRQTCESTWEVPTEIGHFKASLPMGLHEKCSGAVDTFVAIESAIMVGSHDFETGERTFETGSSVCTSSALASSDEHCERGIVSPIEQAAVPESVSTLSNGGAGAPALSEQILDCDFMESEAVQNIDDMHLPALPNSHIRFGVDNSSCSSDGDDIEGINWDEMGIGTLAMQHNRISEGEIEGRALCSHNGVSSIQDERGLHSERSKLTKMRRVRVSSGQRVDISKRVVKYWLQRYSLFGKFDRGVKLDEEGWYSVTPEVIAKHHASKCAAGLVIDAFTGVGGNAIQLAKTCNWVVAIDVNPVKVEYAKHNAEIYGVAHKIEFIVGDFFRLAPLLKADVVFLSPPWGGPEYLQQDVFDLCSMLQPKDGITLFKAAQTIAPNIALFVPRNVDLAQLQELSWLSTPPFPCEAEKNFVNGKLKAVTAYYGDIASQDP